VQTKKPLYLIQKITIRIFLSHYNFTEFNVKFLKGKIYIYINYKGKKGKEEENPRKIKIKNTNIKWQSKKSGKSTTFFFTLSCLTFVHGNY
jgi:hypothetical protein